MCDYSLAAILKQLKNPMTDTRPTSSVVRTISE